MTSLLGLSHVAVKDNGCSTSFNILWFDSPQTLGYFPTSGTPAVSDGTSEGVKGE